MIWKDVGGRLMLIIASGKAQLSLGKVNGTIGRCCPERGCCIECISLGLLAAETPHRQQRWSAHTVFTTGRISDSGPPVVPTPLCTVRDTHALNCDLCGIARLDTGRQAVATFHILAPSHVTARNSLPVHFAQTQDPGVEQFVSTKRLGESTGCLDTGGAAMCGRRVPKG